jgi:hypothetical protein
MVIRFLCPNGHQLSAPENLAGKAGKCPKCGTAFAVPTLEELAAMEAEQAAEQPAEQPPAEEPPLEPEPEPEPAAEAATPSSGSSPSTKAVSGSGSNLGSNKGQPVAGSSPAAGSKEVFVFLCPNGHRLNGPPSLKGKPGQCPHCGARFRIPADDDLLEPEPEHEPEPEFVNEAKANQEEIIEPPIDAEYAEPEPEPEPEELVGAEDIEVYVDPPLAEGHALGYVFARLWDQRQEGTQVELYLKEGEIITPEYYCDNLSCREYAVFANKDGEENYSFTLINWDDVRKINVRHIPILPRPMFR